MRGKTFALGLLLAAVLASGCSLPSFSLWSSSRPVADPTAEALFADGTRYMKEKRYVRAIDAFTKLKAEHPFSPLLTETDLKIADAYYLNEQYPEAINAFKEFQALHPTSEHIPLVVLRLGQAHFNQFSNVHRDQKNTEIAKGYFEAVLTNHPKSPYAAEAREKLAKCNGILAEHEFNIAEFYFKQEKYPAARDRFEEIVRKYPGTPVASRSLFLLGQSYRQEKNNVKAALAYEALLAHYPNDKLAAAARAELAQVEKEKQDPLALLLMRDRRAVAAAADSKPESQPATTAKLAETPNLIAKTEVVYEAPGGEKGMFRRVVDSINPFGSSESDRKEEEKNRQEAKNKSAVQLLANQRAGIKSESKGFFASLWPFGGKAGETTSGPDNAKPVLERVDASLKQKGIDASQSASLKTPAVDLPKVDEPQPRAAKDTSKLLSEIDAALEKQGKSASELTPPEQAEVFKSPDAAQAAIARAQPTPRAAEPSSPASGLLGSIDEKLKSKGVEPAAFEPSPSAPPAQTQPAPPREINLEPKAATEKGPLFLSPADAPTIQQPAAETPRSETAKAPGTTKPEEPAANNGSRSLVPQAPPEAAPAAKRDEPRKAAPGESEENKGTFDQLQRDLDSVGKLLNPFRW